MIPDSVSRALRAFSDGAIIVVTDDADREDEGDLVMAAIHCTATAMAFIIRHSSGIVCTPLTTARAALLNLPLMVSENDAPLGTAFTVSVDARAGLNTGISAQERCSTARALATSDDPSAFVRPGHVFPLIAREGGVLERPGHTEAAVDLCRLAGLPAVAVIAELVNDDGNVMRGEQVKDFARIHGLKQLAIADLMAYRRAGFAGNVHSDSEIV